VTQINIQAAKTHLSRLVEQAVNGKEIVLAKAGKPLVRLVPYGLDRKARVPGLLKGQIREAPNCWEPDHDLREAIDREDPLLQLPPKSFQRGSPPQ